MKAETAMRQAIKIHQGETLEPGTACAHPSDKMVYVLDGYEEDQAVLSWNGVTKRFPASEIFDVNRVKDTAIQISMEAQVEAIIKGGLN